MLPVEKTPEAVEDLGEIWHYIALDSPTAANQIVSEIDEKLKMLSATPLIGRERDEYLPGLRSVAAGKYILFYRICRGIVEIVRIVHGARDLPAIFGKED